MVAADSERHQEVDEAKDHQRAEDLGSGQKQQDHALDHAKSAGHVGDQGGGVGDGIGGRHGGIGDFGHCGQDLMEARRHQREIHRSDDRLAERQPKAGYRERPAAQPQRAPHKRGEHHIGPRKSEAHHTQPEHRRPGKTGGTLREPRMKQQGAAGEDQQTQAHRDPAEHDDPGDLLRRQSPAPVKSIAHGTAAQCGEAQIVPDRQGGEGGKRYPPIGKRPPGIAHAQSVETGQADIAGGGEPARRQKPGSRGSPSPRQPPDQNCTDPARDREGTPPARWPQQ